MWDMESNVFQMSRIFFFLLPPLWLTFFLDNILNQFPSQLLAQALHLSSLPLCPLYPLHRALSLIWPIISTASVCHTLAKHPWALCLSLGSMLRLCLLTTSARTSFFYLSSDMQEIWHSPSSLAERVWTGSCLLQEEVWERHQLRGAVKGAVLLLGPGSCQTEQLPLAVGDF